MPKPHAEFDPEQVAGRLAPIGAGVALTGGCVGGWVGWLLAVAGLGVLLVSCWSRRDGFLLVGPFVRFELVLAARTRRVAFWRFIYAAATFGLALTFFAPAFVQDGHRSNGFYATQAENFFLVFSALQFAYLIYLTTAVIAPIVAEEREKKRWDFLLVTDLRSREILFGKLVGRLPLLLDPVLASLPVLTLVTLQGGVSPRLVVAVGLGTASCVASAAAIAMFSSILCVTAKAAVDHANALLLSYWMFAGMLIVFANVLGLWTFPTSVGIVFPIEVGDVLRALNIGNPLAVTVLAHLDSQAGVGTFEDLFERSVLRLAAFQFGVFIVFSLMAAARLRKVTPWLGATPPKKEPAPTPKPREKTKPAALRPPVGEWPVYWWERFGGKSGQAFVEQKSLNLRTYVIFGIVVAAIMGLVRLVDPIVSMLFNDFLMVVRGLANVLIGLIGFGVIVGPAFVAATCVSKERGSDTLDALRLTALESRDILFQKWVAIMATYQPGYFVLLTITAALVVTGFASPTALIAAGVLVPIYGCVGIAIGLYFSVRAANAANGSRNLIVCFLAGLIPLFTVMSLAPGSEPVFAFTFCFPPVACGFLQVIGMTDMPRENVLSGAAGVVSGVVFYAAIGWAAWRGAVRRFERERHD